VGVARLRRPLALLLLGLSLSLPALDLATRIPELRAAGASQAKSSALSTWLRNNASSVGLVDVGYLGYASGLRVLDLGGLTDQGVAALPGGHLDKRIDAAFFARHAPDALVLHAARPPRIGEQGELSTLEGYPVERRVAALPEVRARYRVAYQHAHAPGYHYVVLVARSPASPTAIGAQ
jgi:hypothetical protein